MTITRSMPLPLLAEAKPSSSSDASRHDAGFGALETSRGRLPLAALDVRGRIDGLLSQMTVRQTFVNATDEPLEATYIFPLPDHAAVTDFRMEVAGRVVEGVLKERGQARREYSQAVRQGHRASIAEEERPGVFSLRVGNLMPGDVATVQLTVVGVLPYRDGEATFRFPLVVAPRYIPGVALSGASVGEGTAVDTNAVPDASRISPPVLLPGFPNPVRLSLTIDLYEPADDPRVSLFTVFGEDHGAMRRLILQPGERLDRDFILRFRLGGDSMRTSLSLHPDGDESAEGTFALTIVPPVLDVGDIAAQQPRDVVLLLDRSGSMSGWKIVAARRAMARMIDTLTDADRFAVFAFDDRIESPRSHQNGTRLTAANDRDRFKAVEFLAKLESRGGTEITQPLDRAVRLLGEPGRDRILVLVTDGQVGNEDQVLKLLGARLRGIRVFTLGIDQAVNEGFLRRLAELGQGGGSCELVESEDRLDAVMDSIHRRIATPIVTEVRLDPESSGLVLMADKRVPDRAPSVFAGSPLLLMGRYRGRPVGALAVCGNATDNTVFHEVVVPSVRDNPAIAAAWARGQVRQLEDRYAAGLGDHSALEKIIIATSLQFGVLCRFTAYVAVDRSAIVNEGGEVHQIMQPVEMPAGWGEQADYCAAFSVADVVMRNEVACVHQGFGWENSALASRQTIGLTRLAEPAPAPAELFQRAGIEVIARSGDDAHGTVSKGRGRLNRLVSVRSLKRPVTLDGPTAFANLQREFKSLKHPAIVSILKLIGDPRTGLVIAMASEFVAGPTLTEWLSQAGVPEPREAARLLLILAEALEYGGQRLMVHGNLTFDRILIGDDGRPRITDFGLARLDCAPDVSCATVRAYVAPELIRSPGAQATATSDVYSLGVIFYRLLTGVLPDCDPGNQHPRSPRAIKPQVPIELEAICLKAISTAANTRYATSGELAADLRTFQGVTKRGLMAWLIGRSKSVLPAPANEKEQRDGFWK